MNTVYINRNGAKLPGDLAEGGCTNTSLRTRVVTEGGGGWKRVVRPSGGGRVREIAKWATK
jgi:hypothetical protein